MPKEPEFELPRPELLGGESVAVPYLEQGGVAEAASAAVKKHTDRLMALEGVVMVAQGQDERGRDCITVGVKSARELHRLPKVLDGIPVVGTVIGEVDALPQPPPKSNR